MADIPSRDELAALDLLIEARARGVTADAGGVNGEISVLAATAHAIRETAGVAEPDRAATWAKVRAGMRSARRPWKTNGSAPTRPRSWKSASRQSPRRSKTSASASATWTRRNWVKRSRP